MLADFNDKVRRGQVIARIDPSTYEAQIAQGNAQVASAQAQLRQAEDTFVDELFAGVYAHAVDTPLSFDTGEAGADFQLGYRFDRIEARRCSRRDK